MDYSELQNILSEIAEQKIRYRTISYKGKGRPKKSDYIEIKRKDLRDYMCFEVFNAGFKTNYTY